MFNYFYRQTLNYIFGSYSRIQVNKKSVVFVNKKITIITYWNSFICSICMVQRCEYLNCLKQITEHPDRNPPSKFGISEWKYLFLCPALETCCVVLLELYCLFLLSYTYGNQHYLHTYWSTIASENECQTSNVFEAPGAQDAYWSFF